MKRSIALTMLLALAISGTAAAHASKKKHSHPGAGPHGGGYYGGKYHGHKQGAPKKPLLRWDGYNSPIKGMKESADKPPQTTPSQSPNP